MNLIVLLTPLKCAHIFCLHTNYLCKLDYYSSYEDGWSIVCFFIYLVDVFFIGLPMTMIWVVEVKLSQANELQKLFRDDALELLVALFDDFEIQRKVTRKRNGIKEMMMGRWFQRKMNPGRDCEVEEEALTREEQ
ncbi:hypothetical protein Hanom_Chr01g00007831 [Helianthus anomalus]